MAVVTDESIEKTRQAIMRFRELLDILTARLAEGEAAYTQFFAECSPEDVATLREKELQLRAAYTLVENPTPIGDAAALMRWVMRDLERDFEQLHDNVMAE